MKVTAELISLVKNILNNAGLNVPVFSLAPDVESPLPVVTIQRAGGSIVSPLNPDGPWWVRADYEISVWAKTNKEKYEIAEAIISGLKSSNPNPTQTIAWVKVLNEGTDITQRETRTIIHRLTIQLQIFYN